MDRVSGSKETLQIAGQSGGIAGNVDDYAGAAIVAE